MSCSNGSWQRQRLVVADAGMLAQLPAAPRRPDKAPQTVTAQPEYGDTVTVEPWWLAALHAPSLETFSLSTAQTCTHSYDSSRMSRGNQRDVRSVKKKRLPCIAAYGCPCGVRGAAYTVASAA
jgi:hypothetical protein